MEMISGDESVRILKMYMPEMGITLPLTEEDLEKASEFPTDQEVCFAQNLDDGIYVDRAHLDAVAFA